MCSGYCWNEKHVISRTYAVKYVWNKIKTLYLPYLLFNSVLLLLNNIFVALYILPEENIFSTNMFFHEIGRISLLIGGIPQLGGPTWFIRSLLVILIANLLFEYVFFRLHHGNVLRIVLILCIIFMAQLTNGAGSNQMKQLHTCFSGYFAFFIGRAWNKWEISLRGKWSNCVVVAFCILILFICNKFGVVELYLGEMTNVLFYFVVSLAGWLLLWCIATICMKKCADVLIFIGKRTLAILLFHYLSFKLVTFMYIKFVHGNIEELTNGTTIQNCPNYLWIVYLLAGIVLPLALQFVFEKTKRLILKCKLT